MDNIEKIIEEKTQKILLNIKTIRESKKISRAKLADKIGVSKDSIYLLEKGERSLTLKWMILFAEHLNCSLSQLLGENISETPNNSQNNTKDKQYMVTGYVTDAMFILERVDPEKRMELQERNELLGEIYKRIYDIYEQKLNKNQMVEFVKKKKLDNLIDTVIIEFLEAKSLT